MSTRAVQVAVGRLDGARAFAERHAFLRAVLPVFAMVVVLALIGGALRPSFLGFGNLTSEIVLASFLAVVSFGQGVAILTGGFDLSVAWVMTLGSMVITALTAGENSRAAWAIPAVLVMGVAIGAANGLGIALFGVPPIVMTLATNSAVDGVLLTWVHGNTSGSAPPFLIGLASGSIGGVPWLVIFLAVFTALGTVLLRLTPLGRGMYAVGNSPTIARLSGVNVRATLVVTYALSGLCAAIAGMLLAGYTQTAVVGAGDDYLLPSIAAVVVGGSSILGGRGHYLATVGGAILLTVLTAVLAGVNVSTAVRDVAFGVVILITVVVLRQRGTEG